MTWLKEYVPPQPGGGFCYVLGTDDDMPEFEVYPNPSADGRFVLESVNTPAVIHVRDLHGRVIHQSLMVKDQYEFDIQHSKGLYILEITRGNKTTYKKLLVN
jgi:hypothetical protein